jgi:hypothetical protein
MAITSAVRFPDGNCQEASGENILPPQQIVRGLIDLGNGTAYIALVTVIRPCSVHQIFRSPDFKPVANF